MFAFLWIFSTVVTADNLPSCENRIIYLNESWSSYSLFPSTNVSLNTACYYTIVYPNDTALCGQFYGQNQWSSKYVTGIGAMDAYGSTLGLDGHETMTCFPPPWFSIFLPALDSYPEQDRWFSFNDMDAFCQEDFNCTKFQLKKINSFKYNETVPVSPGMEPFVLVANTKSSRPTTHNFTGYPKLAAVLVKPTNLFPRNQEKWLDADSFFLYGAGGDIIGTPSSWQGVQEFTQLTVFEMGLGLKQALYEFPSLFVVMSADDLSGLVYPQFIQPYYENVSVDASYGPTSVTIVDSDSHSNYCMHYFLGSVKFSDDVEVVVHRGFPKQTISNETVILKLNSTMMSPSFFMVLGCTNTIRLLKGTFSFKMHYMTNETLNFFEIDKGLVRGFIKTEAKAMKRLKNNIFKLEVYTRGPASDYSFNGWWGDYSPESRFRLPPTIDHKQNTFLPPLPLSWNNTDLFFLALYVTGATTMEWEITQMERLQGNFSTSTAENGNTTPSEAVGSSIHSTRPAAVGNSTLSALTESPTEVLLVSLSTEEATTTVSLSESAVNESPSAAEEEGESLSAVV